jgi:hypothetical protein
MRKTTRVSIILITVGVLLIFEAQGVPSPEGSSSGRVTTNPDNVFHALFLFRGQTVEGNISASAPVNFYVMDETNYVAFAKGSSWQPLVSLLDVSNGSFSLVAPAAGYYHIIAAVGQPQENAHLDTEIKCYGIDLDYYQSGLAFVAVGVVLIAIHAMLYLKSRSSRNHPPNGTDSALSVLAFGVSLGKILKYPPECLHP